MGCRSNFSLVLITIFARKSNEAIFGHSNAVSCWEFNADFSQSVSMCARKKMIWQKKLTSQVSKIIFGFFLTTELTINRQIKCFTDASSHRTWQFCSCNHYELNVRILSSIFHNAFKWETCLLTVQGGAKLQEVKARGRKKNQTIWVWGYVLLSKSEPYVREKTKYQFCKQMMVPRVTYDG